MQARNAQAGSKREGSICAGAVPPPDCAHAPVVAQRHGANPRVLRAHDYAYRCLRMQAKNEMIFKVPDASDSGMRVRAFNVATRSTFHRDTWRGGAFNLISRCTSEWAERITHIYSDFHVRRPSRMRYKASRWILKGCKNMFFTHYKFSDQNFKNEGARPSESESPMTLSVAYR